AQCAPPPSQDGILARAQSTTPPSGSLSQMKMTLADTAGVAQASMAALDTNAAIFGPRRFSRVRGTTTAAKIKLIRSDSQNSGSAKMELKLAPPTHWVGATPVTCGSP